MSASPASSATLTARVRAGAVLYRHRADGFDNPTLVEPFNAEVRALPPEERVAAVAGSLESVWP
jgi:hypothetical protein